MNKLRNGLSVYSQSAPWPLLFKQIPAISRLLRNNPDRIIGLYSVRDRKEIFPLPQLCGKMLGLISKAKAQVHLDCKLLTLDNTAGSLERGWKLLNFAHCKSLMTIYMITVTYGYI